MSAGSRKKSATQTAKGRGQTRLPREPRFSVSGVVEIFQVEKPWVYVRVPKAHTRQTREFADRGLVPVTVTLGESSWDTSLMPMGDGTQFIPLSAKVRKAEGVAVGGRVRLHYILRKR